MECPLPRYHDHTLLSANRVYRFSQSRKGQVILSLRKCILFIANVVTIYKYLSSIEDERNAAMATPTAAMLPAPPTQDEAQYDDDQELQVYDDPNEEKDSEDDEDNHQPSLTRPEQRRGATRTNGNYNASRIFTHIKTANPPLFLNEYPGWLKNVIRATPVFCGLLSRTSTNGFEVLGPEDLQNPR